MTKNEENLIKAYHDIGFALGALREIEPDYNTLEGQLLGEFVASLQENLGAINKKLKVITFAIDTQE